MKPESRKKPFGKRCLVPQPVRMLPGPTSNLCVATCKVSWQGPEESCFDGSLSSEAPQKQTFLAKAALSPRRYRKSSVRGDGTGKESHTQIEKQTQSHLLIIVSHAPDQLPGALVA
eukprot:6458954-Amphidinium_carterae.1